MDTNALFPGYNVTACRLTGADQFVPHNGERPLSSGWTIAREQAQLTKDDILYRRGWYWWVFFLRWHGLAPGPAAVRSHDMSRHEGIGNSRTMAPSWWCGCSDPGLVDSRSATYKVITWFVHRRFAHWSSPGSWGEEGLPSLYTRKMWVCMPETIMLVICARGVWVCMHEVKLITGAEHLNVTVSLKFLSARLQSGSQRISMPSFFRPAAQNDRWIRPLAFSYSPAACKTHRTLPVCFLNVCSLRRIVAEIEQLVATRGIMLMCLAETWLHCGLSTAVSFFCKPFVLSFLFFSFSRISCHLPQSLPGPSGRSSIRFQGSVL